MVAERAQCAATWEHMQIEKAPANQENIFINVTADAANTHNTPNEEFYMQCVSLFGYVVSICSACIVKLTKLTKLFS